MAIILIWLGLYPQPVFKVIAPAFGIEGMVALSVNEDVQ
jgi:hypothetical protein